MILKRDVLQLLFANNMKPTKWNRMHRDGCWQTMYACMYVLVYFITVVSIGYGQAIQQRY